MFTCTWSLSTMHIFCHWPQFSGLVSASTIFKIFYQILLIVLSGRLELFLGWEIFSRFRLVIQLNRFPGINTWVVIIFGLWPCGCTFDSLRTYPCLVQVPEHSCYYLVWESHARDILCGIHTPCMRSSFPVVYAKWSFVFWVLCHVFAAIKDCYNPRI